MEPNEITLFSPLNLRNHKTLRNRVVIPPMASGTATERGIVTPSTRAHYQLLTDARPGLLIVEYTFIHDSGKSDNNQLGISTDDHIPGLKDLVQIIQESGAIAGIQLTHCGGKSDNKLTAGSLMGPSSVPVPVKDKALEVPAEMTIKQIQQWKDWFLEAAMRVSKAGFDLVELHSAHGYGLNQWLSSITNLRTDDYGGSFENRVRLLIEIVRSIREKLPQILISVRIPGQDFIDGGHTIFESVRLSLELEKAGVDIINVSSGVGGWRRPGNRLGEGYLTEEASVISKAVKIPVIGVGGIKTANYIDESLKTHRFTLAAVGRAILENPKEWYELNLKN
ncbi:MAG: NADH:flavin oxidoreductase [Pseudobdellovibrionaceae bacterium]